jgi:hypothetical protein
MLVVFGPSTEAIANCKNCGQQIISHQQPECSNEEMAHQGCRCRDCESLPIELVERYLSSLIIA